MTPFDIATGALIMTIPLIVCAGIIGFFIGEARAKRDHGFKFLRPKGDKNQ